MTPQRAFFHKEFREFTRTWRIWVLVAPVIVFALAGPVFVYYAPEIFESTLGSYADIEVIVPSPTWFDSAMQWTYNLKQIVPILLLVIAGSSVTNEISSGTYIPILTGGLSRRDFVLVKFAVISLMAIMAITGGTLLNWGVSRIVYPDTPFVASLAVIGVASLLALLLISLSMLASTFMPDALSSVGLEMVLFFILAAASFWQPARKYSPAGLLTSLSDIAIYGEVNVLFPALSAVFFTIVLMMIAVRIFQHRDL